MARIVFVGGGVVGTCAAMMLANDGHDVTVLERDPSPPPSPEEAWEAWERRGVNQFRMLHIFLSRFREVADQELPGLMKSMEAVGGLRLNPIAGAPDEVTGGWRDGDERFDLVTARRPVGEAVIATMAAATPGLTIRRGVAVCGLLHRAGADGIPHVTGVRTEEGDDVTADLVVDSGGRRSAMPGLLQQIGSPGPDEMVEDVGFVYYGRHFRSGDGSVPMAFGGLLQDYGTVSTLTLPADNGTWGVGIIASARDTAMRAVMDNDTWSRVIHSFPFVAHWADAEPIDDVKVMAKLEDRHRSYVVDGKPVVTGLLPLADAWACTNPSLGRGMSIGIMHAQALRGMLRETPLDDARSVATRWHDVTQETVQPYFDDTAAYDRHRLAQIETEMAGGTYETDDPAWNLGNALATSVTKDGDLMRGFISIVAVLDRGVNVLSQPGLAEKALSLADPTPLPGPDREQLLTLVGSS